MGAGYGDSADVPAAMTPKEALRLTGMETFVLDYRAPWPVSLVLSRRALTKVGRCRLTPEVTPG